jgi:tetratricopeptide (TPR) repeat protein
VEDPISHERVPTCHRVQNESILADADYLAALEHAEDSYTKSLYEAEAKRIGDIQKDILSISTKEKPYDVFICYKETTESGTRTKDSTTAQDIYYQLENEGFKVFFSHITLEDKLGQQYEPYIFAALHSAKVMVVIGTKKEFFNAIWVKNEWSRYLALMKKDKNRLLIPCYCEMDAYDLPEELSMLQSQDMSKIGFIQDLIRGIKKVLTADNSTQGSNVSGAVGGGTAPGITQLLDRASIFLEDGDFKSADEYFDRVLDLEPKNARAYFGKLLASFKCKKEDDILLQLKPLEDNSNYQRAVRFSDDEYKQKLEGYNATVKRKQEEHNLAMKRKQEEHDLEMRRKKEEEDHYNLVSKLPTGTGPLLIGLLGIGGGFIPGLKYVTGILSFIAFFVGIGQWTQLKKYNLFTAKVITALIFCIIAIFITGIPIARTAINNYTKSVTYLNGIWKTEENSRWLMEVNRENVTLYENINYENKNTNEIYTKRYKGSFKHTKNFSVPSGKKNRFVEKYTFTYTQEWRNDIWQKLQEPKIDVFYIEVYYTNVITLLGYTNEKFASKFEIKIDGDDDSWGKIIYTYRKQDEETVINYE